MDIKNYTDATKIHNMIGGQSSVHFADAAMTDGTLLSEFSASLAAISPHAADLFDVLQEAGESGSHMRYCAAVRQYATCKMALLILPDVVAEEDMAHLEPSLEGSLAELAARVAQLYTDITNLPAVVPEAKATPELLSPATIDNPARAYTEEHYPEV